MSVNNRINIPIPRLDVNKNWIVFGDKYNPKINITNMKI